MQITESEEVPDGKVLVIPPNVEESFYFDRPQTRAEWAEFFTEVLDRGHTLSETLLAFTPIDYALLELDTFNPPLH